MKAMIRLMMCGVMLLLGLGGYAQQMDDERMQRDIEVAENVLATLIKQHFNNQRTFFPLEVNGTYQQGYGVTFTIPADFTTPIIFGSGDALVWSTEPGAYSYNIKNGSNDGEVEIPSEDQAVIAEQNKKTDRLKDKAKEKKRLDMDSVKESYNLKVIDAAKTFIVDYGDMITQLAPNEKIVITNQGGQPRVWVNRLFDAPKRTHLSIEAQKSDLISFKQGKLNRNQVLSKIKVLNTQTVDTVEPDFELLNSIFNRLYHADLSKTYFTEDNIYYEHLKDFGVIYYMQVFSTKEQGYGRYGMPTLKLNDIDLDTRNKKVTEIYPQFEKDLKENILEYGKTVKSLKDEEVLVFQVRVTRCPNCGIPSTLEYTVKGSVLKDFGAGKLDKAAALNKIIVKKGPNQ
jgi:hypothetical protein